jgi:hypothetical protein
MFAGTSLLQIARVFALLSVLAGVAATVPSVAAAQAAEEGTNPVTADFKGMIGLGLIGAELGLVIPAVAGLQETWSLIVFPVAGAAGGAVAGYFLLEQGGGEPELAVASLMAGMALLIPAIVTTLAVTAYEPEEQETITLSAARTGLVRVSERGLTLAAPAIGMVPGASERESLRTGASTARELRVGLVSGQF